MTHIERAPAIILGTGNWFADNTMAVRVPNTIREIQALNPDFPASIIESLELLRDEIQHDRPVRMIAQAGSPDYEDWLDVYRDQAARVADPLTWLKGEWFFAETFFYRHVMEAVRWFETGRDPFLPKKQTEIDGDGLWSLLDEALHFSGDAGERLAQHLAFALWGNRIDLSFKDSAVRGARSDNHADWLADDRAAIRDHLLADGGGFKAGDVHIVADNTGTELTMDLCLIDFLLREGIGRVMLHLKMHPTFISDAIPADVWHLIAAMEARGGAAAGLGSRLRGAWEERRLILAPDLYWNGGRFIWDMPPRLHDILSDALLVIFKGDANYRRIVGDALWPVTTPFAGVLAGFPAPVCAIRTMKSDPVVGLAESMEASLYQEDPDWRVNGQRGVIHFAG